jgi:hypothetical protein
MTSIGRRTVETLVVNGTASWAGCGLGKGIAPEIPTHALENSTKRRKAGYDDGIRW